LIKSGFVTGTASNESKVAKQKNESMEKDRLAILYQAEEKFRQTGKRREEIINPKHKQM